MLTEFNLGINKNYYINGGKKDGKKKTFYGR